MKINLADYHGHHQSFEIISEKAPRMVKGSDLGNWENGSILNRNRNVKRKMNINCEARR